MAYKHGTYGSLGASETGSTIQTSSIPILFMADVPIDGAVDFEPYKIASKNDLKDYDPEVHKDLAAMIENPNGGVFPVYVVRYSATPTENTSIAFKAAIEKCLLKYSIASSMIYVASDAPAHISILPSACVDIAGQFIAYPYIALAATDFAGAIAEGTAVKTRIKTIWPAEAKKDADTTWSLVGLWLAHTCQQDARNGCPMETPSNRAAPVIGATPAMDRETANQLNAVGVSTAAFVGGQWKFWGPHSGAFTYGTENDALDIFETNFRMQAYVSNEFVLKNGGIVDHGLTRALRDRILFDEQARLDALKTRGALIYGTIEFRELENPSGDLLNGDFRFDVLSQATPLAKSLSVVVSYTDKGLSIYFE